MRRGGAAWLKAQTSVPTLECGAFSPLLLLLKKSGGKAAALQKKMARGFSITGRVEGLAAVSAALKGLPDKLARRVLRKALTKATKPTLLAAKANARKLSDTGALAKSITRKTVTYVDSGHDRRGHRAENGSDPTCSSARGGSHRFGSTPPITRTWSSSAPGRIRS